jgi:hypothetical protein
MTALCVHNPRDICNQLVKANCLFLAFCLLVGPLTLTGCKEKKKPLPHAITLGPGRTPPRLYGQFIDGGASRNWLMKTLQDYEKTASQSNPQLSKQAIRALAVNRFANDYSEYWGHNPVNDKTFRRYVANMNVATDLGLVNIDWMTTLISTGTPKGPIEIVTSPLPLQVRYPVGKLASTLKVFAGGPPPNAKDLFPQTNWNAVKIIQQRLFNPNIPFDKVFQAPAQGYSGKVSINGLMGVSTYAGSKPLRGADLDAYLRSKAKVRHGHHYSPPPITIAFVMPELHLYPHETKKRPWQLYPPPPFRPDRIPNAFGNDDRGDRPTPAIVIINHQKERVKVKGVLMPAMVTKSKPTDKADTDTFFSSDAAK